jgi:predicted transcriptional regulator
MNELLEIETRRNIYNLIVKNPGLHLSKIAQLLRIRLSLVEYHLRYLEKNNIIYGVSEAGYKRYYIENVKIGVEEKRLLSLLRQETPLRVVLFLLKHPHSWHKDILKQVNVGPSTLSYHLNKLVKKGILVVSPKGEEKGYTVADEKLITGLLIRFKPYLVLESFKDVWVDLQVD